VIVDLSDLGVVDGHCHPLLPDPWAVSPATLLDRFSEGRPGAMAAHVPHTGYYRRAVRALASLYQVEPTPEAILARRQALGPEVARRLLVERRVAAVWPQVFVDLSQMPLFLGPGSIPPLIEILALAPASKLLYGSDVGALPELFGLAAHWTRAALGEALGWLAERGELTVEEARAAGRRILSENAVALYGLPAGA
jgi:hypothetical protein